VRVRVIVCMTAAAAYRYGDEKRKTIIDEDIPVAMQTLGLDNHMVCETLNSAHPP
jgi:histone H3/H4